MIVHQQIGLLNMGQLISITLQKLIETLSAGWAIVWTAVAIMSWSLNTKPSPPLPFAFFPQGYHSITIQYSASVTVGAKDRTTVAIVISILLTKIPDKITEMIHVTLSRQLTFGL